MKKKNRDTLRAYIYLSPAILLFIVFFAIPIVAIIGLSFTEYNMISPPQFVGFKNYVRMLFEDNRYFPIVWNTFKYVLIFVPAHTVLGFLIALGINRKIPLRRKYFYRTVVYFPVLVTTSAVSIVWIYLYDKEFGLINYYLTKWTSMEGISWLTSSQWAYLAIAIFGIWKFVGQPTIYYLVGLQNLPSSVLEAADIDGANFIQKLFRVVLPMISPTIFFVVITVLINTLQIFEAPYILTKGGPNDVTRSLNLYIYEYANQTYELGYASTLALSLFVIILFLTFIMLIIGKKYVYYENE